MRVRSFIGRISFLEHYLEYTKSNGWVREIQLCTYFRTTSWYPHYRYSYIQKTKNINLRLKLTESLNDWIRRKDFGTYKAFKNKYEECYITKKQFAELQDILIIHKLKDDSDSDTLDSDIRGWLDKLPSLPKGAKLVKPLKGKDI